MGFKALTSQGRGAKDMSAVTAEKERISKDIKALRVQIGKVSFVVTFANVAQLNEEAHRVGAMIDEKQRDIKRIEADVWAPYCREHRIDDIQDYEQKVIGAVQEEKRKEILLSTEQAKQQSMYGKGGGILINRQVEVGKVEAASSRASGPGRRCEGEAS
jgi:Zn finger protein HypA/HybF involved in hydrogenase expression